MTFTALIHGIGSIGPFTSRAFLPAFITALLLRFGPNIPLIAESGILDLAQDGPTWFTHDVTIIVLGLLSLLEIAATKNPDARQMLEDVGGYLKTGMALVTFLGILSATDVAVIEDVIAKAGVGDYVVALVVAGGVYFMSRVRSAVLSVFADADEDDESGVQGLISWFEDLWSVAALILLVAFPVFMLILILIAAGLLLLIQKALEHREEKSKTPCTQCQKPIYACAVSCPHCRAAVAAPRDVGFLGQSKASPAPDPQAHPFRLVEKKRCPVCATRLGERRVQQTCTACGHELMADRAFAESYLAHVQRRMPKVLLVSFLLSLIPVIGLVPGVIYYRLALVAPFRRYLPLMRRFVLKWLVRLVLLVLIAFQWVPGLGGLVVPAMALISYGAYRSAYRSDALHPVSQKGAEKS